MRHLLIGMNLLVVTLLGCGGSDAGRSPGRSDIAESVPPLDAGKVPADLRDLVPLAQRWGIGDDVMRTRRLESATEAEKSELRAAFAPRQRQITAWLDSFGQEVMPAEAAAFMYTQLAIEEMP